MSPIQEVHIRTHPSKLYMSPVLDLEYLAMDSGNEGHREEGTSFDLRRIGYAATISAPHMHAHAVENLLASGVDPASPMRILDVGSGSGYRALSYHIHSPKI